MNKFIKIFRVIKYRKKIWGEIGENNNFTKGVLVGERSIIGNNNYFGFRSMIINCIIGNYCSIAPSVIIGPAEHSKTYLTTYNPISSELSEFQMFRNPSIIGNDVWIGANVVIRQGVKIGNGAIIGANSFVNKDIPDFAIAVGSPARVINYRFDEDKISKINKSKWWEYEVEDAKKILLTLE